MQVFLSLLLLLSLLASSLPAALYHKPQPKPVILATPAAPPATVTAPILGASISQAAQVFGSSDANEHVKLGTKLVKFGVGSVYELAYHHVLVSTVKRLVGDNSKSILESAFNTAVSLVKRLEIQAGFKSLPMLGLKAASKEAAKVVVKGGIQVAEVAVGSIPFVEAAILSYSVISGILDAADPGILKISIILSKVDISS